MRLLRLVSYSCLILGVIAIGDVTTSAASPAKVSESNTRTTPTMPSTTPKETTILEAKTTEDDEGSQGSYSSQGSLETSTTPEPEEVLEDLDSSLITGNKIKYTHPWLYRSFVASESDYISDSFEGLVAFGVKGVGARLTDANELISRMFRFSVPADNPKMVIGQDLLYTLTENEARVGSSKGKAAIRRACKSLMEMDRIRKCRPKKNCVLVTVFDAQKMSDVRALFKIAVSCDQPSLHTHLHIWRTPDDKWAAFIVGPRARSTLFVPLKSHPKNNLPSLNSTFMAFDTLHAVLIDEHKLQHKSIYLFGAKVSDEVGIGIVISLVILVLVLLVIIGAIILFYGKKEQMEEKRKKAAKNERSQLLGPKANALDKEADELNEPPEWDDNLLASQKSELNNIDETMRMDR
ncbi:hypothetical protein WR25_05032 [Diploscapter pachys]|uniref:VWFA domain-containing protein n=1 Tax=Diploscapter pachys TaxID=2018661 RepID=A0A2A2J4S2_9BILA|nr:hypothetical protein WR25_05032 [Diploscapter pachys]